MILNPDQVQAAIDVLNNRMSIFIAKSFGQDFLSTQQKEQLLRLGINLDQIYSLHKDPIFLQYQLGQLSQVFSKLEINRYGFRDFLEAIRRGEYVKLNQRELDTLKSLKMASLADIRSFQGAIFTDVNNVINQADKKNRQAYEKVIRKELKAGFAKRQSYKEIAQNLGNLTGDWARRWDRIVQFQGHLAFDEGRAAVMQRKGGDDAEVYKITYPGACKHCIAMYRTAGEGSEPIVYKLSELKANGTNIGKKVADWKPVIGPVHPHSITDKRTSILTSSGWKMIKDIEIGEFVLTHKLRFRRVINKISGLPVPRNYDEKEIYDIYIDSPNPKQKGVKLNLTANHKILTNSGWKMAKDLKESDKLYDVYRPCSNDKCENLVRAFGKRKTCCKDCENQISASLTKSFWEGGEKTEKIKEKIISTLKRRHKEEGLFNKQVQFFKSKENREATSKRMFNGGALKAMKAGANPVSGRQIKLFNKIKSIFPQAEFEYEIFNKSLDIAIPEWKIDIEYDGSIWHNRDITKESDKKRDALLNENGWKVIRYVDRIPTLKQIKYDIETISNNDEHKYESKEVSILKIEKRKIYEGVTKLWDLEVEEDESFVARGIIIHNCRCTVHHKEKGQVWSPEKQMFVYDKEKPIEPSVKRSKVKLTIGEKEYMV
jgi:hypothetical protein